MVETQHWNAWKSIKSIRTITRKQTVKVFISAPEKKAPTVITSSIKMLNQSHNKWNFLESRIDTPKYL